LGACSPILQLTRRIKIAVLKYCDKKRKRVISAFRSLAVGCLTHSNRAMTAYYKIMFTITMTAETDLSANFDFAIFS